MQMKSEELNILIRCALVPTPCTVTSSSLRRCCSSPPVSLCVCVCASVCVCVHVPLCVSVLMCVSACPH